MDTLEVKFIEALLSKDPPRYVGNFFGINAWTHHSVPKNAIFSWHPTPAAKVALEKLKED